MLCFMRVFEPQRMTFLTTYRCTTACRHCGLSAGPHRNATLSYAELERLLEMAFEELDLKLVVFSGGEPLLLGDDLLRALALCKQQGITTRVVTNAYFADTLQSAHRQLETLRDAGLDQLNISTDDYHLTSIPLSHVRHAFDSARKLGFRAVVIVNCHGPLSNLTPKRLFREFGSPDMQISSGPMSTIYSHTVGDQTVMLASTHILKLGRASRRLRDEELFQPTDLQEQYCGCSDLLRWMAVSPKGHLLGCCGYTTHNNPILDLGSLADKPLATLLDQADNDLILNFIAILGPLRVRQILEERVPGAVTFPHTYRSACEVCADLVGIRQNRESLFRHQGLMLDVVMAARAAQGSDE